MSVEGLSSHPEELGISDFETGELKGNFKDGREVAENRTQLALIRVREEDIFFEEPGNDSELGYYRERPIIGRGTPINGGIYLGGEAREAIVVDDKESFRLGWYNWKLGNRIFHADSEYSVLAVTHGLVNEIMPYDPATTKKIAEPYYGDKSINLGAFVKAKAGVCRHQALLAGYLLESLINQDRIPGKVSVRRNTIDSLGAHCWAEYEADSGDVYVIDPAQQYLGLKEAAHYQGRWRY